MAATTTLITFLVRTPPMTRSVDLYGSWDNFNEAYPMHRDSRVGREHWSGCHNFANIICDGDVPSGLQPREGGLKMGGTYWYYYKLDDDIEFHNASEPSTTACPMLPGQLVNVLHVPFAFSSGRSRNASVSSAISEWRTMNPDDKFMNPRPVPRPSLPRLKTSPSLLHDQSPSGSSPGSALSFYSASSEPAASYPNHTGATRMNFRSKKSPFDMDGHPLSSAAIAQGIRSAIRALKTPRSGSPETVLRRTPSTSDTIKTSVQPPEDIRGAPLVWQPSSLPSSREQSPTARLGIQGLERSFELPLRQIESVDTAPESLTYSSFQHHRRQRSRSREPSSLRNSMVINTNDISAQPELASLQLQPLDTLEEVASAQNTPAYPITARKLVPLPNSTPSESQLDLEKRLPTLPNTPSSAYPASAATEASVARRLSAELANLESHFSATTIDSGTSILDRATTDRVHFSTWSSQYSSPSAMSMSTDDPDLERIPSTISIEGDMAPRRLRTCELTVDDDGRDTDSQHLRFRESNQYLSSTVSCSTMSSTTVSSLATSPMLNALNDERWERCMQERGLRHQHYSLPQAEAGLETISNPKNAFRQLPRSELCRTFDLDMKQRDDVAANPTELPHTTSMQQLLDDLSYLGNMIHSD